MSSTLLLLVVGVLWGLNWPAVKFMMAELPPFTIRAIAFPLAALILASITLIKKQRLLPVRDELVPLIVTGTFLVFTFNMLTSLGQSLTDASQAAIVAYITVELYLFLIMPSVSEYWRRRRRNNEDNLKLYRLV